MKRSVWQFCGIGLLSAGIAFVSVPGVLAFPQGPGNKEPAENKGTGNLSRRETPDKEKPDNDVKPRKKDKSSLKNKNDSVKGRPMVLTPAREAAAMTFASLHHPELAQLLMRLKHANRAAYQRAVRQLYLDSERLARIKERSADRYELELELWKTDSRIRLLVARLATADRPDPELESQLRDALRERSDLKIRQLEMERQRLMQRIEKIDETISTLKANREKSAEQHLQRVFRSLGIKKRRLKRNNINRADKSGKTKTIPTGTKGRPAKNVSPDNPE